MGKNQEQNSSSIPKLLSQKEAVTRSYEYVKKRKSGDIVSMKTCFSSLNYITGGIEVNTMMTISGLSGGGKSTLAKRVINSMIANLKKDKKDVMAISFNFEMLAHKTIGREISNMSRKSLAELYSSHKTLSDKDLDEIYEKYYKSLMNHPIYYIEEPQDALTIGRTIYYYWKQHCKGRDKYLIIEVDHASITRANPGQNAKEKIDQLMETLNYYKKKISNEGGNIFFLVLCQMNRSIKSNERMMNSELHYPMTSDLFQSSTIEHFSDYILVTHMPNKINLKSYTDNEYPIYLNDKGGDEHISFIYWHLLKNRDGEPDRMIPMLNNLKYFDFVEVGINDFKKYHAEFKSTGECFRI